MFWNNFITLCNKHNTKPNPVAKTLNLSSGSVTKWKNGATPNDTTLKKIADYFGVSVDYLIGKTDTPTPEPRPADTTADDITEGLTPEEITELRRYADFLRSKHNK